MSPGPAPSRPLLAAAAALALVAGVAAGCSGDDEPEAAPTDTFDIQIPDTVDEVCTDPEGDLLLASGALADEPTGVDLVGAEAHLVDEVLDVTWSVVGDPAAAPTPWFTVMQGTPGAVTSWELRVDLDDAGNWRTQLFTNESVDDDVLQVRQITTPLPIAPRLEPTAVRLTVPMSFLPPAASVAWLFGATSGDGRTAVFDDCSNLYSAGPDDTAPDTGSDTAPDTTPTEPAAPDGRPEVEPADDPGSG